VRVISGLFKGKKIFQPKDNKTRPLKDLVKESIFNIIEHSNKFNIELINSNILDFFSGVGSFGIECLSRGSKKVVFVENYYGVLPILKKNLSSLKLVKNYEILESDIYKDDILGNLNNKFDIIFLDPPFRDKRLDIFLIKLKKFKILNKNGVIIIHRHKNENDNFPKNFRVIEEKKYGISKIFFISYSN
tara:strand:+ start:350 stop:916 length:567 start_codon:yes stop_codon:yes gene_type:complete